MLLTHIYSQLLSHLHVWHNLTKTGSIHYKASKVLLILYHLCNCEEFVNILKCNYHLSRNYYYVMCRIWELELCKAFEDYTFTCCSAYMMLALLKQIAFLFSAVFIIVSIGYNIVSYWPHISIDHHRSKFSIAFVKLYLCNCCYLFSKLPGCFSGEISHQGSI